MAVALGSVFADVRLSMSNLKSDATQAKDLIKSVTQPDTGGSGGSTAVFTQLETDMANFRGKLGELGTNVSGTFSALRGHISDALSPIATFFAPIGTAAKNMATEVGSHFHTLQDTSGSVFEAVKSRIRDFATTAGDAGNAVKSVFTTIKDHVTTATTAIGNGWNKAKDLLSAGADAAGSAFNRLLTPIGRAKDAVGGFLGHVGSGINSVVTFGAHLGMLGMAASAAVGAVVGTIQDLAGAAEKAEYGQAQLGAVLKSTGGVAGMTAQSVNDLAAKLMLTSTASRGTILSAETMLLEYTHVGKDIFPQATQAILNMSTAMHVDLTTATKAVGKALENPLTGMTSLQRVGVMLTQTQKDQIKSFMALGDTASAQGIIMGALNRQFGGAAAAQAGTYAGRMEQLKNQFEAAKVSIGMALIPALSTLMTKLQPVIALFAAELPKVIKAFTTILSTILIPVLLTVADFFVKNIVPAIGELTDWIVGNLVPAVRQVAQFLQTNLIPALRQVWTWFTSNILPILKAVGLALRDSLGSAIQAAQAAFRSAQPQLAQFGKAMEQLKPVAIFLAQVIGGIIVTAIGIAIGAIRGLIGAFKGIIEMLTGLATFIRGFFDFFKGIVTGDGDLIKKSLGEMWSGITGIFKGAIDTVVGFIKGFVEGIVNWFKNLFDRLVGHSIVVDLINGIVNLFFGLPIRVLEIVAGFIGQLLGKFGELLTQALAKFAQMMAGLASAISNGIGAAVGAAGDLVKRLIGALGGLISGFADAAGKAMQGLANGIKNGIGNALGAVKDAAGSVLGGIKSFFHIGSPSKDFADVGDNLMAGLAAGIDGGARKATGALNRVLTGIAGATANMKMGTPAVNLAGNAGGFGTAAGGNISDHSTHIHGDVNLTVEVAALGTENTNPALAGAQFGVSAGQAFTRLLQQRGHS